MRMVFLPGDGSFQAIVETQSYKDIWKRYAPALMTAFADATGLTFQQKRITARVHPDKLGDSGNGRRAMILPGNCRTTSAQQIVLTHELGHRLLSGNVLQGVRFGFSRPRWGTPEDDEHELEHRLLYLFLGDVVRVTFGDEVYRDYVAHESSDPDSPHGRAYIWATQMSKAKQRAVIHRIAADAMTRDMWDSYDPAQVTFIGPDAYRKILDGMRDTGAC